MVKERPHGTPSHRDMEFGFHWFYLLGTQKGYLGTMYLYLTSPYGWKGPSEVTEPKPHPAPNIMTSCSSAASFIPYHRKLNQMKKLRPRTDHSTNCEKLLDGVQSKSDALQFQTAVNVSVLQGYREQC